MLKILGRTTSINVRKVLWACDYLGLQYEREDWGRGVRPTSEPEFLALNPNAQIPVLIEGDFVLWESQAILRYLATTEGDSALLPQEIRPRAIVNQWLDWYATGMGPAMTYGFHALGRQTAGYDDRARVEDSVKSTRKYLDILEQTFEDHRAFVAGDTFTLADIPVALGLNRWRGLQIKGETARPRLERYMERISGVPGSVPWCTSKFD
ncbi:glutathione S-transferase family protein [Pseudohoeflea suaedae]|nr:glutathione S-transferase family protein [Pseudohoeflea suaedae]